MVLKGPFVWHLANTLSAVPLVLPTSLVSRLRAGVVRFTSQALPNPGRAGKRNEQPLFMVPLIYKKKQA